MGKSIKSGTTLLQVLEAWGVDHVYGIPGGSFNTMMNAFYERQKSIRFIQVRHEETGAIAASAEAKLTGKIGVCFGSAGPGATHLFNGLYDAKMDRVPVLALVGQVPSKSMNYNSFQELNENPMFADVSVYNRTVMTPESLPFVVDEAIRQAYRHQGVAVVTLPVDFGAADIPGTYTPSARNYRETTVLPAQADVEAAVKLIEQAKRPVLYVGQGICGAAKEAVTLSEHYSMPIVASVMAKGILPENMQNFMGTAGRLSTKPANEALAAADLILFIGSNFPFARFLFPEKTPFIQVDIDSSKLGSRHRTDVAILGDAGETMRQLVSQGRKKPETEFLKANRQNRKNWLKWLSSFENRRDVPLRAEPVFREIDRIASDNAVFVTDVGNVTIHAVRLLKMNSGKQQFTTSGLFATMGYGVPGGIGAALSFPGRQIFTLSGDGGFAMVMQEIITQVKYRLPVINVVFSNNSFGFIEAEQEDTPQPKFGIELAGADYGKLGEAMGARGFTVTREDQLKEVFDAARESRIPVVIDIKLENKRPFPAEAMVLDPEQYSRKEIEAFKARYEVSGMPLLKELLGDPSEGAPVIPPVCQIGTENDESYRMDDNASYSPTAIASDPCIDQADTPEE